jgi:hypothetical protein
MSISTFTSDTLRSLVKLTEKKDSLVSQISKIESEISSFLTGKPAPVKMAKAVPTKKAPKTKKAAVATKAPKASKKAPAKVASAKRGPKGGLGKKVVAALEAAGEDGVKVVDLAKKLKVKLVNLHVWFATTGKKNPAIKKVGKGHYKLEKK